jgi:hypothetical protein
MPGLDPSLLSQLDFSLSSSRITKDIESDFVFAPHLKAIHTYARDEVVDRLSHKLRDGTFNFSLPLVLPIPKPSGLTRPGAILFPFDRLLYQILADTMATEIESQIDREHVFSNVYKNDDKMFEDLGPCYARFKQKIRDYSGQRRYCLRTDVASFFETIYQHFLINLVTNLNIDRAYTNLLEKALFSWREQNSHGILQGLFPSDLFGNFYLTSIDYYLQTTDLEFCRFVDDYYIFADSLKQLVSASVYISEHLRSNGLFLSESKTKFAQSDSILREDTEFDTMFANIGRMIDEAAGKAEFLSTEYGFQDWDDESDEEEAPKLEIEGIRVDLIEGLYSARNSARFQRDQIVKFCVPLLARIQSEAPLGDIDSDVLSYPHLTKAYASYLANIGRNNSEIGPIVERLLLSPRIAYEYQHQWLLAALLYQKTVTRSGLDFCSRKLLDRASHESLRVIASIILAKHGAGGSRKLLRDAVQSEPSEFVKASILFATKYFPSSDERKACRNAWGALSEQNEPYRCIKARGMLSS